MPTPTTRWVPAYDAEFTPYGLRSDDRSDVSNDPKHLQHLAPAGFQWLRSCQIHPPFTAQLTVHFPEDGLLHILNVASPLPLDLQLGAQFAADRTSAGDRRLLRQMHLTLSFAG